MNLGVSQWTVHRAEAEKQQLTVLNVHHSMCEYP